MEASLSTPIDQLSQLTRPSTGPLMVGRTVTQYIQAGVTALHLEDQVQSKRCGHLLNKQLVGEEEFITRIRAAAMVRETDRQATL